MFSNRCNPINKKLCLSFLLLVVLLLSAAVLGLCFGSVPLSFRTIITVLFEAPDIASKSAGAAVSGAQAQAGIREGMGLLESPSLETARILLLTVRLPRVVGGIFAGAGLAAGGVILQTVMNNALASPNTIGVNAGAGFGVMCAMFLFPAFSPAQPLFAFLGALCTTLAIFLLAALSDSSRLTIILAGIAVSSFLNAGINTLKLLDTDLAIDITSFLIGSLSGLSAGKLFVPCTAIAAGLLFAFALSGHLNLLSLGDDIARSLGLRVRFYRFVLLLLASLLSGAVVSYAGLLGFVGLIVPHAARRLFGNDARVLLPSAALLGASFVVLCDLCGRVLFAPFELPAGLPLAFIGGPFFLWLLLRGKGGRRLRA